jgi:hypothetical protein
MREQCNHRSNRAAPIFLQLFLLVLLSASCETPVNIDLIEGNPPVFTSTYPNAITGLSVCKIPKQYMEKEYLETHQGIPGEILNEQTFVWSISSNNTTIKQITYGILPTGWTQRVPAKPLEEGGFYLILCSQNRNGGCYGPYFVIKNGKALRYNGQQL